MAWAKRNATDFKDCLDQINDFATKTLFAGAVTPGGGNTGDGVVYGASGSEHSVDGETWTLECTTGGGDEVAVFSVTGSDAGVQVAATSGVPYSIDRVSFIILAGDTDWVAGGTPDSFTFSTSTGTAKWTTEESDLASSQQHIILNGVGGGSDEIFAGFRTQSDDATYFNMEVTGFSGYVATSDYEDQPGYKSYYACMSNSSFDFYIVTTSRHIKIIPIVGVVYEGGYTGWFLPTATASQYSYPQFVGGSTDLADQTINDTGAQHTNYWAGLDEYNASGSVNDGSEWREIPKLSPISYGEFENWIKDIDDNRRLYAATLLNENQIDIYGTLEGIYYITNGDNALTPQDVITDGDKGYIVFRDVTRPGAGNVAVFDLMGDV